MDDETLTAYHESGHAVIAYTLGGQFRACSLVVKADDWLPARFGSVVFSGDGLILILIGSENEDLNNTRWPSSRDGLSRRTLSPRVLRALEARLAQAWRTATPMWADERQRMAALEKIMVS